MSFINWLHLSDMHMNSEESFDQNVIHDAFLEDIKNQIHINKIKFDFIFFTGDVAFSASNKDYKIASAFFENLCKSVGVSKENLFIVPGNHDVNRYKVSKILDDERKELNSRENIRNLINNKKVFNEYLKRFDNYSKFISALYNRNFVMNSENFYFSEKRVVNTLELGIIGLNSSWASFGGRHDSNNIYISELQLIKAIEKVKKAKIKIVLLHHPPSWLFEEDQSDIENLFYQNCHIILHGHLHKPDFQISNAIRGDLVVIPAGAIFSGRRISNSYNYVSMDIARNRIRVSPRRYYEAHRKFLTDIECIGIDNMNFYEVDIPVSLFKK